MARYIDADKLNEYIQKEFEGVCVYDVEPSRAVADFQEMVDAQPTVFDTEKVVSELKKAIERNVDIEDENGDSWNDDIISADKAIEIVRKGGLTE